MSAVLEAVQGYVAPTTLAEALAALADPRGATVLAGGTDLMVQAQTGRAKVAPLLVNIRRVAGLDGIAVEGGELVIGALVTISTLLRHQLIARHAPLLAEAADHFASVQIRNAATLGGNIGNASPAGDTLPPLLALDAEIELARFGEGGSVSRRRVPAVDFFTGPGRTLRQREELIAAVRVPLAADGTVSRFYKGGTRPALDIASIGIAFAARRRDDGALHGVRLALGAVAPVPMRARAAEALLEGRRLDAALAQAAAEAAAAGARPIDDVRASAWYRRELLRNMTQRMLDDVTQSRN